MELNINIQKLGTTDDIFGFYRYLTENIESKNHVLLESVEEESSSMLFSFVGLQPDFMIKVADEKLSIYDVASETGEQMKDLCENSVPDKSTYKMPFQDDVPIVLPAIDQLQKIFPISKSAMPELFPRKIFSGGLLGYIGYDIVSKYVGYKPSATMQEMFPDIVMGLFTKVLAYSHTTKTMYMVNNTLENAPLSSEIPDLFQKFRKVAKIESKIPKNFNRAQFLEKATKFRSNTTEDAWASMIEQTKKHIYDGDIIQAVISRKMIAETDASSLDVYQALKILNPSPYMYHMNFEGAHNGDVRIIGSSPEALITKNHTNLETVPIAGTRRRGRTPEDELRMEQEILNSEKEVAEHIMLVDLARNDLARVSVPGTVDTYKLLQLKKFPNIMHLISKVRSQSHLDPFTILKSVFPAGTVSGAPKKRAMEIIHKLELEDRGPYSGVVGYINFTGDMDMAISIRTMFNKNKTYIAQAGAGIVADSNPAEEYLETANKMKGILSTINFAEMYGGK